MLKSFVIIVMVFVAYIFYWNYQDRQAQSAANQFCNAVVIGSVATNLAEQAKAAGARVVSGSNANPQLFFFPGPIFNGFWCEVGVADGKVVSHKAARHDD